MIFFAILLFLLITSCLALIDWRTGYLPDNLTFPLLITGLAVNAVNIFIPFHDAILGAVAGFLILWIVNGTFQTFYHRPGLGMGDAKLLAALGAWLGWQALPSLLLLSAVMSLLYSLVLLPKGSLIRQRIPYGPGLTIAGMITILHVRIVNS